MRGSCGVGVDKWRKEQLIAVPHCLCISSGLRGKFQCKYFHCWPPLGVSKEIVTAPPPQPFRLGQLGQYDSVGALFSSSTWLACSSYLYPLFVAVPSAVPGSTASDLCGLLCDPKAPASQPRGRGGGLAELPLSPFGPPRSSALCNLVPSCNDWHLLWGPRPRIPSQDVGRVQSWGQIRAGPGRGHFCQGCSI